MQSKVMFGYPKWPQRPFCDKISKKIKVMILRQIRLKVIFGKPAAILWKISEKWKLHIDMKWQEIRSKVIFGRPKWPLAPILWNKFQKNESCVLIWNGKIHMHASKKRNCCSLSGVPLGTDWTTVYLKCLGSIRYPLNEYKTSTKILTDCRHYPGDIKMASL